MAVQGAVDSGMRARPGLWQRVLDLADMVRLEEVLFSLPLAFAGAFLGARGWPPVATVPWITAAVVGGKVGGMAFNRLIDRDIDAQHPETANRHLPAGRISPATALIIGCMGLALLAVSAVVLNPLCALLLPVVIGLVVVYSFTKRWGWGCHFALAAIGFFLPFSGWIAVTGRLEPGALVFGAATGLWYVGFDSLYALRDVAWDRRLGVHSLPADLGVDATLRIARTAHALFLAALAWLAASEHLPWPFWTAGALVGGILLWQHVTVTRALRPVAFARFNAVIAFTLLVGAMAGVIFGIGG